MAEDVLNLIFYISAFVFCAYLAIDMYSLDKSISKLSKQHVGVFNQLSEGINVEVIRLNKEQILKLTRGKNIGECQRLFADNMPLRAGFDCSSIGFHNWLKEYRPDLLKRK